MWSISRDRYEPWKTSAENVVNKDLLKYFEATGDEADARSWL
jgi:hypothetical protein